MSEGSFIQRLKWKIAHGPTFHYYHNHQKKTICSRSKNNHPNIDIMKLSNSLFLVLMAAALNDVSCSKSGKGSARIATGVDYDWVVGNYTECRNTDIVLTDGEPRTEENEVCDNGQVLVVERLGADPSGLTFQATFQFDGPPALRYIYEGVGSYNPRYKEEVMFYADHSEEKKNGTWEPFSTNEPQASDVATLRVSQLGGDGSSVVGDFYVNKQVPAGSFFPGAPTFLYEAIATYLFIDVDSE